MSVISKEDIIHAFQTNQRKRNLLLYTFYKDKYFSQGFPAKFIATKLSQELGITITENMVFLIIHRIAKKGKKLKSVESLMTVTPIDGPLINQKEEEAQLPNQPETFQFKNADEYPKKNPFADVLKGI